MIKQLSVVVLLFLFVGLTILSCRKEPARKNDNMPPVASAGTDLLIILPTDSVILNGNQSRDADGTITIYQWSKIFGPSVFSISNPKSSFTIVKNLTQGIYRFELKVTDDKGLTSKDTVMVTVDISAVTNHPPVAAAGTDQTIRLPDNSVFIDGSGSFDPDNNIASYQWSKISGPSTFKIENANAVQTQVTNLEVGLYNFKLEVRDAGALLSRDTVRVIVVSQQIFCDIDNRPIIQARLVPLGKLSIGKIGVITAAANNKILFAGGSSYERDSTGIPIRRVDIYDINSNRWSTKDLYEYPTWRMDMGIAAVNNKVLLAGGGFWGDDLYTNRVDIYNASDDNWSNASLSENRTAIMGISAGNKVFFAGGFSLDNGSYYWSNTVDIYDDATNTWTTATLSDRRGSVSAVAAGNKIYFAGGAKNDGNFLLSNRIDEYDMVTNSWSFSSLREARSGMAAIAVGNKIFWAGGSYLNSYSNFVASGTVEIRDIVTGAISFACIIPKSGSSAVLKDDKIIFFTGWGGDPRDGSRFDIYNITTDTWYTAVLDKTITGSAVISVNNVIYVAGGYVNGVGSDVVWKLEF